MNGAIEYSTFQKRPAYRYIRETDKLPTIDEARLSDEPQAIVKLRRMPRLRH